MSHMSEQDWMGTTNTSISIEYRRDFFFNALARIQIYATKTPREHFSQCADLSRIGR